ncbi:hypothetical protein H2198_006043 [Neophaeococcomyces mojaviensis]|uniref:Uncharacterized protein n=1 Tax=Neophaeococcomyces mojaviensis TaxID=3383035 RepID=A0ACC3A3V9_9EURO|nr:hypothetical protein H2198_006043 [Knufia sp. JES_112]
MAEYHVPGSFSHTAETSSSTPFNTLGSGNVNRREGKFESLMAFVNADEQKVVELADYRPATEADLRPGSIIHVWDKNGSETRLHNRILLVKARHPLSMICFSFCKHKFQLSSKHDRQVHWRVVKAGAAQTDEHPAKLTSLEVSLHNGLAPQDNITINLRDPWNVEYNVSVATLGEVSDSAWQGVRDQINHIFVLDQLSDATNNDRKPMSAAMKRERSREEAPANTKAARKGSMADSNKSPRSRLLDFAAYAAT